MLQPPDCTVHETEPRRWYVTRQPATGSVHVLADTNRHCQRVSSESHTWNLRKRIDQPRTPQLDNVIIGLATGGVEDVSHFMRDRTRERNVV